MSPRFVIALVSLCTFLPGTLPAVAGETHALLINGGSKPTSNYQSHLLHLQDMVEVLQRRGLPNERIHIFSADGEEDDPDLAVRDMRTSGFWLIDGTATGRQLRPRTELTDTKWSGVTLQPARKKALRKWFKSAGTLLAPGDRLLIFVTDHGTENTEDPDNGAISLWEEDLTVREFEKLLHRLNPGVQAVMIMSQCYSGTFASAMYDGGSSEPTGELCGFFSTSRELRAYGCYPEGRDRDKIGHAFRFIDALDRQVTTIGAHLEVLVTDMTPDAPLRTSDVYLERLVGDEAEDRGLDTDVFADTLLSVAWQDRAGRESEIRLLDRIGHAFGTFSPRSLAELDAYEKELPELIKRMKTYSERWKATLVNVKQENLASFMKGRPEWGERLQRQALSGLDAAGRQALVEELLPELERHARESPGMWQRLEGLRERARQGSEGKWRLEVRNAALRRMRSILLGIAGRVLLEGQTRSDDGAGRHAAQRRALQGLDRCEAFDLGALPGGDVNVQSASIQPFPPLEEDLELMQEILPSWLGVRFRAVPPSLRSGREDLTDGAAFLDAVYADSPALEAGLVAGDIVLGPPDRPFEANREIREWTMTSARDTPLALRVLRPGDTVEEDREFEATLSLRAYPLEWPKLQGPPQLGQAAPPLPGGLEPVSDSPLPDLRGRPHVLFFWATWCKPCKLAVPEVMAYASAEGHEVIAISDESSETVAGFLDAREEAFFEQTASDPRRKSFISYGVSGTPTIILVDGEGIVRHRQVGYNKVKGLTVQGWSWNKDM
jgi:thiol-disulfide isomerase/thioredoxin